MIMANRLVALTFLAMISVASAVAAQPAAGQEQFVPIDQLPPSEQLPAALFLITAYAFVWVALLTYVWSVWRRIARVEEEVRALQHRVQGSRTR